MSCQEIGDGDVVIPREGVRSAALGQQRLVVVELPICRVPRLWSGCMIGLRCVSIQDATDPCHLNPWPGERGGRQGQPLSWLLASSRRSTERNPGSHSLCLGPVFDIIYVAAFAEATDWHASVPDEASSYRRGRESHASGPCIPMPSGWQTMNNRISSRLNGSSTRCVCSNEHCSGSRRARETQ